MFRHPDFGIMYWIFLLLYLFPLFSLMVFFQTI